MQNYTLFLKPPNFYGKYLFAESAALALAELSSEAFLYKVVQTVAQGTELHLVYHLVDECLLEEQTCLGKADATLPHVEQGCIVQLAYSGAVGTLHIVGIDLEHGLGVHTGLIGCTEVLVGHLRDGLLSPRLYQHTPGKGSCGVVVEYIFI